jgi:hypothetical protein
MRTALGRTLAVGALAAALMGGASSAQAAEEFEKYAIESVSVTSTDHRAGAHPDLTVDIQLNRNGNDPYAYTKEVVVRLPPGMAGNPKAAPTCTAEQLGDGAGNSACPFASQVGTTLIRVLQPATGVFKEPVYNMTTPKGMVARLGFIAGGWPAFINVRLDPEDHTVVSSVEGLSAASGLSAATTTLWGVPALAVHDEDRITPEEALYGGSPPEGRSVDVPKKPFMVNPTECTQPRQVTVTAIPYPEPHSPRVKSAPFPPLNDCGSLAANFNPSSTLKPTTAQGTSGSGLDYSLALPSGGLENPDVSYDSEMKTAEVKLPVGMSVNPSQAEGLGVCSEADLARETYNSAPDVGCPETSKIGSVTAKSPVIDESAQGSLYVAKPYDNPFGSLLALYMVLKIPDRAVLVKLAGKVTLDPDTGQITTVFDDIPQLPVSEFELHFREGARAPLVTPPTCGTHTAISNFTPWADAGKVVSRENSFQIESGPDHGPCPTGGLPPFNPGLRAYSTDQVAGAFSPFYVSLTRKDDEQEITHFSIKLPPGLTAKLAGVPFCSDLAIAAAIGRTGAHGGEEELAAPACPAASQIGTTLVGAGVGNVLVYVPGKVYLAGPYNGAPISVVAVTAAKAGPFDLGTVVVREALRVDPETAEVFVDATGSDPIPHIIKGVPVHLRDIRVSVDRPQFALNPTDCTPTSTASTVLGAGLDFVSAADDRPVTVANRFQVADCGSLGFKPKLALKLKGGTKRNQVPALEAVLNARPGDANIARSDVVLPRALFLEQGHIQTICTRVQFNAGAGNGAECPAASVYGHARADTPLLDEPLEGPVFLRSNGGERDLPDLVAALRGQRIDINLVGYIDSVREKTKSGQAISRIRNRFVNVPDAPVTRFVLNMQGGKKGLLVNSTNLCAGKQRADVAFTGQNGRVREFRPAIKKSCKKKRK